MLVKLAKLITYGSVSVCLFFLTLGQFSQIGAGEGINIYLFDLAILLFIPILFLVVARIPPWRGTKQSASIFFLAFSAIGLLSLTFTPLLLNDIEYLISFSYLLRFASYVVFGLFITKAIRLQLVDKEPIERLFILSGVVLVILGYFQLIVFPDFELLPKEFGWDPHKNRMASTFFDPNFLGMYLVLCLGLALRPLLSCRSDPTQRGKNPCLLGSFARLRRAQDDVWDVVARILPSSLRGEKRRSNLPPPRPVTLNPPATPSRSDGGRGLVQGLLLSGIILTFSRSAYGALAILFLIIGIKYKKVLVAFVILAIASLIFVPRIQTRLTGITDPADSASFRLVSWTNTLELIKDNPLVGVGFNAFRYAQKDYGFITDDPIYQRSGAGSDSSLLLVLATTGVVGFGFYIAGLGYILFGLINQRDYVASGMFLALILNSFFINSLFYLPILFFLVIILSTLIPSQS